MRPPPDPPSLPPRTGADVGALPAPFSQSQIDYLPQSVTLHRGEWLASTNAWGDRRLARLDRGGAWQPYDAPDGWLREPRSVDGSLAVLCHEANRDRGVVIAEGDKGWHDVRHDVEEGSTTDWNGRTLTTRSDLHATVLDHAGGMLEVAIDDERRPVLVGSGWSLRMPAGVTVTEICPSPDRCKALIVVRTGSRYRSSIIDLTTGRRLSPTMLDEVVHRGSAWLDDRSVVVIVERWPSLAPLIWHWADSVVEPVWPSAALAAARSIASDGSGVAVAATSTPDRARQLVGLRDADFVSNRSGAVRTEIVRRGGQLLPCLVYEPDGDCVGTLVHFPGGPHEPVWPEHAPLADTMTSLGWRVVRANTRSSGLREARFRPDAPIRYGVDDVADAVEIVNSLGLGTVVTMGMSYGAFIAASTAEASDRCVGAAVLSACSTSEISTAPDTTVFASSGP